MDYSKLEEMFQERLVVTRDFEEVFKRQEFIDSIDLEGIGKYVSTIRYCGNVKSGSMIIPFPFKSFMGIKGVKNTIEVYRDAFGKYCKNLDEFLSTLIDCEGFRAKEMYANPKIVGRPIFPFDKKERIYRAKAEIRTYNHQLKMIRKKEKNVQRSSKKKSPQDLKFIRKE